MSEQQIHLNTDSGWLRGVQCVASPNADERPPGCNIDLLVIHGISLPPGCFGGNAVHALFCNTLDFNAHDYYQSLQGLNVSAHLLIERTGATSQFVSFQRRAWHAGVSSFQGRAHCNDYSIGIELEGTDDVPYGPTQYQVLAHIVKLLMFAYPGITPERIVGHCDIAPGRKTDPGPAFDWSHLHRLLATT